MSTRYDDDFDPDSPLDLDQHEARFTQGEPAQIPATKVTTSPPASSAPPAAMASLNPLDYLTSLAALDSALLDTRDDAGGAPVDDAPEAEPVTAVKERRRFAPRPDRHATIPGLFRAGSINLLIGATRSGKTLLALSQFDLYARTGEFLGYQTPASPAAPPRPAQLGAIIVTGTIESIHDQIQTLALEALSDPTVFPVLNWRPNADETLAAALRRHHDRLCRAAGQPVHLLFIDGFQFLLEGSGKVNDPSAVLAFYQVIDQFCLDREVTILGTINTAKFRTGERYSRLGDRAFGSIAWPQMAATLIGLEQVNVDLPEERRPTYRKIVLEPRLLGTSASGRDGTIPRATAYANFDEQGRLMLTNLDHQTAENATYQQLDGRLDKAQPGDTFTKDDLIQWGEQLGVTPRTVERWAASRCDETLGMLERQGTVRSRTFRKPLAN